MIWARLHDITKHPLTDVHFTTGECGHVGVGGEWVLEDVTGDEQVVHPGAAGDANHDRADGFQALGVEDLRGFLSPADVFAIACVVH